MANQLLTEIIVAACWIAFLSALAIGMAATLKMKK